jgi:ABC-2 type transport system ATP-binding protein
MFGRLSGMSKSDARARADELLHQFDLADAADRVSKGYSGGMRRRLDLASSLMARPPILFLDEPTTGLDPRSRLALWQTIQGLVTDGITVLLTTQYLEEADRLAQRIAVLDKGDVIAVGSPGELKARVGGESVEVAVVRPADLDTATRILAASASEAPRVDVERNRVIAAVADGAAAMARVSGAIAEAGIATEETHAGPDPHNAFRWHDDRRSDQYSHPGGTASCHLGPRALRHRDAQGVRENMASAGP